MKGQLQSQKEVVICNLCNSSSCQFQLAAQDWLYGSAETFNLVRCENCGLVYLNPRPPNDAIGRYYPRHQYYAFQRLPTSSRIQTIDPHFRRLAKEVTRRIGTGMALDVGSGNGSFMLALRALGWAAQGVELDADTARYQAEHLALDVLAGDFVSMPMPERKYDLITMLEVLEHLHDPLVALQRTRTLLKPGGVFLATVPNIDSLEYGLFRSRWVALEPPLHLYFFTMFTLRAMLEKAGLIVDRITTTATTDGLTRSLWLLLRQRLTTRMPGARLYGRNGEFHRHSWRRTVHGILNIGLAPIGAMLRLIGKGPGLVAWAHRS